MDRARIGLGLKLQDFGGDQRIGDLDQASIVADLREAGAPPHQLIWFGFQPLTAFDRILLARDGSDGRCRGALLIQSLSLDDRSVPMIEAIAGGPTKLAEAVLKRMLAFIVLRYGTDEDRPVAILARTRSAALCRALRAVAGGIGGTSFYPEPDDAPVALRTAGLAHRMARAARVDARFADTRAALAAGIGYRAPNGPTMAMVDLRSASEKALDDDARRLLRARLPRSLAKPPESPDVVERLTATRLTRAVPAHVMTLASREVPAAIG